MGKKSKSDKSQIKSDQKNAAKTKRQGKAHENISSEIKIANAGGHLEGGDNKQWHMDQGAFDEQEKKDFENCDEKTE